MPMKDHSWGYLSVWQDLYSRYIVGWRVFDHMRQSLIIESFKNALYVRRPNKGLIVHSDGGGQSTAESWFSRLKAELLENRRFEDMEHARRACYDYIDAYYNTIRKHSSLGYKSPLQFERELIDRN